MENEELTSLEKLFFSDSVKTKEKLLALVDETIAIKLINDIIKPHSDEPDFVYWNLVEKQIKYELYYGRN